MPQHSSPRKKMRSDKAKKERNHYLAKSCRTFLKKILLQTELKEAIAQQPAVVARIDKLAKKNIIHWKKSNRLKAKVDRYVQQLTNK